MLIRDMKLLITGEDMKKVICTLSFLLLMLTLYAGVASATSYNLGELIRTEGSIEIGDKIFSDFGFTGSNTLTAGDITVTPSINQGVYFLVFQGGFIDLPGGSYSDWGLFYTATSTGPGISMIDQSFNLTGGVGVVTIGESVWDAGYGQGNKVAQSTVTFTGEINDPIDPTGESSQGDDLIIDPALAKVYVQKDIFVAATADDPIGATIISQSFHQPVPEPGSLLLLGSGILGLGILIRKRAK